MTSNSTSHSANVQIVQTLCSAYARVDYDGATQLVSDSIEWTVVPFGITVRGPEGFRQMFAGFKIPFPDSTIRVSNIIDGGEWVVMEYHFVGTHLGTLASAAGEIPATGRPIDIPGLEVYRIYDGRIAEFRTYFDNATMMAQLGLLPTPSSSASQG